VADLPESHPYAAVGVEGVRAGLALFDSVVGDAYRGEHTDRNALVPTPVGTVTPAARYPATVAAGLASDPRDALLVGFETHSFDAPLAAARLSAAGVPFDVRGVTVRFPGDFRPDAAVTRLAAALDRDEPLDGRGARAALARVVAPHLDDAERVGFPAVLGDEDASAVRSTLARRLDADVFEVPTGPPSLPGLRLERRFERALEDAGVRVATGNPAVGYEADGDRLTAVRVDHNGRTTPFRADQFVLATGGLVGKGLDSDREAVREPLFDCHVPHPEDRTDWAALDPFGDHAFARFGVPTDGDLRPVDESGAPEVPNLRAAGSVLGGADVAAENCASGLSLATGTRAGRAAARDCASDRHHS
jgi:glycerol-3-phosphate dehydrogenase subunit B